MAFLKRQVVHGVKGDVERYSLVKNYRTADGKTRQVWLMHIPNRLSVKWELSNRPGADLKNMGDRDYLDGVQTGYKDLEDCIDYWRREAESPKRLDRRRIDDEEWLGPKYMLASERAQPGLARKKARAELIYRRLLAYTQPV
jgi:hypothetical protein